MKATKKSCSHSLPAFSPTGEPRGTARREAEPAQDFMNAARLLAPAPNPATNRKRLPAGKQLVVNVGGSGGIVL